MNKNIFFSRKNIIIFFACAVPFISFTGTNLQQLYYFDFLSLSKYFAILFLIVFLLIKLLSQNKFFKDKEPEIIISYAILIFFNYNTLKILIKDVFHFQEFRIITFILWLSLFTIIIYKLLKIVKNKNLLDFTYKFFSFFFFISFIFFFLNSLTLKKDEDFNFKNSKSQIEKNININNLKNPRNVYYILLDSYPRQDSLINDFDYDNSEFLRKIKSFGFHNISNSISNTDSTHLNQTLVFDMSLDKVINYYGQIEDFSIGVPREFSDWKYGYTSVHRIFHKLGYLNYLSLDKTFRGTPCRMKDLSKTGLDKCITQKIFVGELEINFLQNTPIIDILGKFFPSFISYSFLYPKDITNQLGNIINNKKKIFYYLHFMIPHPPPKYDDACRIKTEIFEMNIKDHASSSAKKAVKQDIKCLNNELLDFTKSLNDLDPDSIEIFKSDNGWFLQKFPDNHFNINIWKLPSECKNMISKNFSNVNTFRVVFNCLGVANFNLVEDKIIRQSN